MTHIKKTHTIWIFKVVIKYYVHFIIPHIIDSVEIYLSPVLLENYD